jgi:hypothetical protein
MKATSFVRAGVASALMLAGVAYAAEMTLYTAPNFNGAQMTVQGAATNLERTGFNDRTESVIVRSGRWEVCTDANYSGYCAVMGPGEYSLLSGPLFRRVSSAREVASTAYIEERYPRYSATDRYYVPPSYEDRGRYSALEVYTLPGFRGSSMKFDRNATSLDTRTDELSSLVVREGVWEICTGLDYNGHCRVYEPGRYPRLGSFEGARIGSLRRVG